MAKEDLLTTREQKAVLEKLLPSLNEVLNLLQANGVRVIPRKLGRKRGK